LVTGDKDGQLIVWDAQTGEKVGQRREAARGAFLSAAYSPLGKWIVSASEDCVARVYDAESLELVHRFLGHVGAIHCLDVSNQLIATGGRDHLVKIWP
jgi:WD40 repeat protein